MWTAEARQRYAWTRKEGLRLTEPEWALLERFRFRRNHTKENTLRCTSSTGSVTYTRLIDLRKAPTSRQNRSFVVFFRCGRVLIANKSLRSFVPISSWAQPPIFVLFAMLSG